MPAAKPPARIAPRSAMNHSGELNPRIDTYIREVGKMIMTARLWE